MEWKTLDLTPSAPRPLSSQATRAREDAEEDWMVIYLVDCSRYPSEYSKIFDILLPNQNDSN